MGQGACAGDGTTCCPFFNTDGSCTTACPTNYAASNDTNYTCGKYSDEVKHCVKLSQMI